MKPSKGQKISEWLENPPMDEEDITTARVYLILGALLGFLAGSMVLILEYLILTN